METGGTGRHLLVRLPVPRELSDGTLWVEPDIQLVDVLPSGVSEMGVSPVPALAGQGLTAGVNAGGSPDWLDDLQPSPMALPEGVILADSLPMCPHGDGCGCSGSNAEPLFGRALSNLRCSACDPCGPLGAVLSPANRSGDEGIGRDRLILAPFELDSSQPNNSTLFRIDLAHGFPYPDRAEYLWAKPGDESGKGPAAPEFGVDYQDFRFRTEIGGPRLSVATEIPLRSLDPVINRNTTGMGDMNVTTKTVLLDGKSWQLTQILRTHVMTGAFGKGLGTGHVAMEPGVLATCRWRPTTFIHHELKYWFPIAGDPIHSGQVLRYGLGYSHLLHETDAFAIIHTGEFVGLWFLDGGKMVPQPAPLPFLLDEDIDNEPAYQFYPGLRFVADTGGDCGLIEFGLSGTFSMGRNSLFDSFLRFDVRLSY